MQVRREQRLGADTPTTAGCFERLCAASSLIDRQDRANPSSLASILPRTPSARLAHCAAHAHHHGYDEDEPGPAPLAALAPRAPVPEAGGADCNNASRASIEIHRFGIDSGAEPSDSPVGRRSG